MLLTGCTVLFSVLLQAMVRNDRSCIGLEPYFASSAFVLCFYNIDLFIFSYVLCHIWHIFVLICTQKDIFMPLKQSLPLTNSPLRQRTGRGPHLFTISMQQTSMATWFPWKNTGI